MHVRVIVPPEPIVTPSELAGTYADDDAAATRAIMAAQRTIDGPSGRLQIAIGPQTLEWSAPAFCDLDHRLPFPPLIDIESITYLDEDDAEQTVDAGDYRRINSLVWWRSGLTFPVTGCAPDAVRVRYRAGYDGEDVDSDGTGEVPDEAKQAVILMAQHMLSTGAANLFLSLEEVEGVGRNQFIVTDQASKLIETACERLLQGLKVYA